MAILSAFGAAVAVMLAGLVNGPKEGRQHEDELARKLRA
jgi:hypothetical protein